MDGSLALMLVAVGGLMASGLPAVVGGARGRWGTRMSSLVNVAASVVGFVGMVLFWREGAATHAWVWGLPVGRFAVGVDALGLVFLVPVFLISALGSVYGLTYWRQRKHPGNGRKLRLCWGLLAGAMALVVLARDSVLFLMAWEIMALAAFMLVATEDYRAQVRKAAWVYLVATHVGTLCLVGFFALLRAQVGTTGLWGHALPADNAALTALLILGMVGFGMKAGLLPLHIWLPGAHANAPSHVSAMLSGVMLKMGVYGLFRVVSLTAVPPIWWGALVLALGAVTALVGIAYAVGQGDYKRLLAYSSIENIGIVAMGLGLALLGRAAGRPEWVALGAGAALLHVLNHSLFKPLLFMGAGNLLHAAHTRRMDRLGGLAKKMPATFGLMVVGAVAICGLPPLNGFASEFLLYVGMLKTSQEGVGAAWGWAALGVPALAAVGALAVTGFVKLLGMVFLGEARYGAAAARQAHDPQAGMWGPMGVLAGLCVVVGVVPWVLVPVLDGAVGAWCGDATRFSVGAVAPLGAQMWLAVALLGGMATALAVAAILVRRRQAAARTGTWDCGYARPTARMQYTGSSFGQMVVDLAGWAIWPRAVRLRVQGMFPARSAFKRGVPDVMLERVFEPALALLERVLMWLRDVQQRYQRRAVQAYLVYVLVIIVVLILVG